MGLVPDFLIRLGIRYRLQDTLITLRAKDAEDEMEAKMKTIEALKTNPTIAIATDEANDQHYEVPAEFYDLCLGPRKKYSSGYWPTRKTTFEESEEIMLDMYCKRAGVKDGMKIVDIGCGWGSLTLYLCEKVCNFCFRIQIQLRRCTHNLSKSSTIHCSFLTLKSPVFPIVILNVNSFMPMPKDEDCTGKTSTSSLATLVTTRVLWMSSRTMILR
jgi:hypothetical protein